MDADTQAIARRIAQLRRVYTYLRDTDLESQSGTSRLLRHPDQAKLARRVSDEVAELRGVLDGSHTHEGQTPEETLVLECSQVWYWAVIAVLADGRELDAPALAEAWATGAAASDAAADTGRVDASVAAVADVDDVAVRLRAVCEAIGMACASRGVSPVAPLDHDIAEMRRRPYLAEVIADVAGD